MPLTSVNPEQYQAQLQRKARRIERQFAQFNPPPLQVFESPPLHYRQRAEFRIWHQDDDTYCVMFKPEQPDIPVRVDRFPLGSERLMQVMAAAMERIRRCEILRRKLFQIEFLTTLSGEALVTLIYHRKLDEQWQQRARQLQSELDIKVIGRSRKQKLVLNDDFVTETLTVDGRSYRFRQIENSFTQPNARINEKMLAWARERSLDIGGDLLELYCGNGNFTAVLAANFGRVLATEISKTSVKSARYNFIVNGIDNIDILRMSSEEFTQAMDGVRTFRRLKDIDLNRFEFSTVLVDPPRAGLDPGTEQLVGRFEHILYISCNPDTLHNNLVGLCRNHAVEQFAIFDQFPYTEHIECGVKLKRLK